VYTHLLISSDDKIPEMGQYIVGRHNLSCKRNFRSEAILMILLSIESKNIV